MTSDGYTPVMLAAKNGLHDVVDAWTKMGANTNQEDPDHRTLLWYYLFGQDFLLNLSTKLDRKSSLRLAEKLIERGANINAVIKG